MDFFDPKIPKKKVLVEILHTHSSQYLLKCMFFLNTSSKYRSGMSETVQEYLHNCGQFVPIKQVTYNTAKKTETSPETISLYNINEIIYIKETSICMPEDTKDLMDLIVTLKNKSTIKLAVTKNIMGHYTRLAEYSNSSIQFLKFVKNNIYIYINKDYIFSMKNI